MREQKELPGVLGLVTQGVRGLLDVIGKGGSAMEHMGDECQKAQTARVMAARSRGLFR